MVGAGVVLVALGLCAACGGGSSPAAPSGASGSGTQGLAATWRATRAEFVNTANSSVKVEIVSRGASLVLALDVAGGYTRTVTTPGDPPDVQTGTWSASRDVLTLRPSGVTFTIEFDYSMSGNTLALSGGHVEFDFNDDNRFEEAILTAAFARQ
jgi:hypothetical protein